ncbi:MAG: AAA family ATPase [Betaproteobacteria bacterium]|nr:AAA family ATPase [Betaproteobacteria bacterium]MDH3435557.1 AAA family ATPase [Betaproteobacteria bacterium]
MKPAELERQDSAAFLPAALLHPECYPHPVREARLLETHISWVLLTGDYAYKIKKPVNLGFLDFSTLGMRGHYCDEELRLNRRLAPEFYLEVVPVRGTTAAPHIGGEGPLLDYAVKMREFPQDALASRMLERGQFGASEVDALAAVIADFHAAAAPARAADRFGAPEILYAAAMQNFEQILPRLRLARDKEAVQLLREWTEREFRARHDEFAARKRAGHVRECHGDLHLGNIVVSDGRPVPFDCIEFNDELRWIDILSEVAFVVMDLHDRGRADLGWRFLNRYLEASGDYDGLAVLRFYLVYRALVRAKVHLIRSQQPGLLASDKSRLKIAFHGYLGLASRLSAKGTLSLLITHGLSGSGKTTATQTLVELLGAVRVRSDVERKRLYGMAPLARSQSGPDAGIYTAAATAATYDRLITGAECAIKAGYPAVVDAAFLKLAERERFRALAYRHAVPFVVLHFDAPEKVLRERVTRRAASGSDASEADLSVLERQMEFTEPLSPEERLAAITIDTRGTDHTPAWRAVMRKISRSRRA